MNHAQKAVNNASSSIEAFLLTTSDRPQAVSPGVLRYLADAIETSRQTRALLPSPSAEAEWREQLLRYGRSLAKLHQWLQQQDNGPIGGEKAAHLSPARAQHEIEL